jgi:hypothetical protein
MFNYVHKILIVGPVERLSQSDDIGHSAVCYLEEWSTVLNSTSLGNMKYVL